MQSKHKNLLSNGINQAVYAMKPARILNIPVHIHFRSVYKIKKRPQNVPIISQEPEIFTKLKICT